MRRVHPLTLALLSRRSASFPLSDIRRVSNCHSFLFLDVASALRLLFLLHSSCTPLLCAVELVFSPSLRGFACSSFQPVTPP